MQLLCIHRQAIVLAKTQREIENEYSIPNPLRK